MSDLGLLSHQYRAMAELSRQLRHKVLYVKRTYYDLPIEIPEELNSEPVKSDLKQVALFLSAVVSLNEEQDWPDEWADNPPLPSTTVYYLRKKHEAELPRFEQRLDHLAKSLDSDIKSLSERDIALLEEFAQAANLDTNMVFGRLMQWA